MLEITGILTFLGIIQGVAEFLPISSSGHLVLMQQTPFIKNIITHTAGNSQLFINVALHVATLIAVIIYLRKDIFEILTGFFVSLYKRDFKNQHFLMAMYILVASIPAGIIGILFNNLIENYLSTLLSVSIMLILNGIILTSTRFIKVQNDSIYQTGFKRSLLIGFFQAFAIIPGISRSGSTISGALLFGLEPEDAARFSFLMSLPVIAGAGLLEGIDIIGKDISSDFYIALTIAMAITVIVALFSMKILFVLVKKMKINYFGFYTAFVGIIGCIIYFI